jgi:hypothetical protein
MYFSYHFFIAKGRPQKGTLGLYGDTLCSDVVAPYQFLTLYVLVFMHEDETELEMTDIYVKQTAVDPHTDNNNT